MSRNFQRFGRLWMKSSSPSLNSFGERKFCHSSTIGVPVTSVGLKYNNVNFRCFSHSAPSLSKSSQSGLQLNEDKIQLFVDPTVQNILKELTGRDLNRIFRKRKMGQKLREPKYTFMTESQLQKAREEAEERAGHMIQMPPVLRPRKAIDKVLSFDPCLQSDERSTLIFTDITMNVPDRDRIIVARDPDGTLRQATWEERDKMNAIYFPVHGREFITPKLFTEPEVLQSVLDRANAEDNTYELVLDWACLQFEPDNPIYCSTTKAAYETIDHCGHYDFLKSTRHFGSMVFYLIRMRKMDGILLHSIQHRRVSTDASRLVDLFHIMFPECKSKIQAKSLNTIEKVRKYIELDAIRKGELELAINAYLEEMENRTELEEGLKRQHGLNAA